MRMREWLLVALVVVLLSGAGARSGIHVNTTFSNTAISNNLLVGDSLILSIAGYRTVRIFDDSIVNTTGVSARSPDIVSFRPDSFSLFWAEPFVNGKDKVFRRDAKISYGGVTFAPPLAIDSLGLTKVDYLHANTGNGRYLVSYLDNNLTGSVRGTHDSSYAWLLRGNENTPYSSQCWLAGDTFVVTYRDDASQASLYARKVRVRDRGIDTTAAQVIARGVRSDSPQNNFRDNRLLNSAVAADQNKNVLFLFSRGRENRPKWLEYVYTNRTLSPPYLDSGFVKDTVGLLSTMHNYDDAAVVTYGPGKFAATSWDSAGVFLHLFVWNGLAMDISTTRLVERTGCRFSTIAANDSFMVVLWKGDNLSPGSVGIEGIKYSLAFGEPPNGAIDTLRFSSAARKVTSETALGYGTEVNAALDSLGNIGVTWLSGDTVWTTVLANRTLRHVTGSWTSEVETLSVAPDDSVRFYRDTLSADALDRGAVAVFIQTARSANDWAGVPWVALDNVAALNAGAIGVYGYYRYRLDISRNLTDSLYSPIVRSITIPYNIKPVMYPFDSLRTQTELFTPQPGDTITVAARSDSLTLFMRAADSDSGDQLSATVALNRDTTATLAGALSYALRIPFAPLETSDSVYAVEVQLADRRGWQVAPQRVYVRTFNNPPQLSIRVLVDSSGDGMLDTIAAGLSQAIVIQESDSIGFLYSYTDSNDPDSLLRVQSVVGGSAAQVDSLESGQEGVYWFHGGDAAGLGMRTMIFTVSDPDTAIDIRVRFGVNHFPRITAALWRGTSVLESDSISVTIGARDSLVVSASDPDVEAGRDSLTFWWRVGERADSVTTAALSRSLPFTAQRTDSSILVVVRDQFGFADSLVYGLRYQWVEFDTAASPAFGQAVRALDSGFSLVVGAQHSDTLAVPFFNTGNDTVSITALRLADAMGGWLRFSVPQGAESVTLNASQLATMQPFVIWPGQAETLLVIGSIGLLTGDGVVSDTLHIATSDPLHADIALPITLEHNELPRLMAVSIEFAPLQPYWLAKSTRALGEYAFAPHARLRLTFSEPVDSASVAAGVILYSVLDSAITGVAQPLPILLRFSDNGTRATLAPDYREPSGWSGIQPLPGMYVPTDSIALRITSAVTDRAQTPSGPNELDLDGNLAKSEVEDTVLSFRVDSVGFTLSGVSPLPGSENVAPRTPVELLFSGPLMAGSIDTARTNNTSLFMSSTYSHGDTIGYDSVRVDGAVARFYPAVRFYAGDSVHCHYRGYAGRDHLGYPVDIDNDGIAEAVYDSLGEGDDFRWFFKVRPITVTHVAPDSGEGGVDVRPAIRIRFSDQIFVSAVDTTSGNENVSFSVVSSLSGWTSAPLRSVRIGADSASVTITLQHAFFSNDTVRCMFNGFSRDFRYGGSTSLPRPGVGTFGALSWEFRTTNEGFYTFPNPYKPRLEPRHCSGADPQSPCGIWFKNLHVYDKQAKGVRIIIYTMNTDPVFDTRQAGIDLKFGSALATVRPEWKWDTKNSRGNQVASGIYLYTILNHRDKVMHKGKLMIVR